MVSTLSSGKISGPLSLSPTPPPPFRKQIPDNYATWCLRWGLTSPGHLGCKWREETPGVERTLTSLKKKKSLPHPYHLVVVKKKIIHNPLHRYKHYPYFAKISLQCTYKIFFYTTEIIKLMLCQQEGICISFMELRKVFCFVFSTWILMVWGWSDYLDILGESERHLEMGDSQCASLSIHTHPNLILPSSWQQWQVEERMLWLSRSQ